MTDQQQVPVNQWPVNQAALRWLKAVKEPGNPQVPYVIQLAAWGLEQDGLLIPDPLAPSQPTPEAVRQVVYGLAQTGRKPAFQAMERLVSNPNLSPGEEMSNLKVSLSQASTPLEAAQSVVQVIYDLMVATSPSAPE